ncbi:MAG: hypothetical protein IPM29_06605 [Planctomycetes bacterium]|nr:hypothetical protein [Planctomycetota bacterium]
MNLNQARDELEDRLTPAGEGLARQRRADALRAGLGHGAQTLPRLAGVLAIAFIGVSYALGSAPVNPWALPGLLLVAPFASALAFWWDARRRGVDSRTAALAFDEHHHTKDRVSAALDLAERPSSTGSDRAAALARAAIEDGLDTARRLDAHVATAPRTVAVRVAPLLLGIVIACVPAVLLRGIGGPRPDGDDGDRPSVALRARDAEPDAEAPADEPNANDAVARRPGADSARRPTATERADETAERPRGERSSEPPRTRRGTGAGAAGGAAPPAEQQLSPSAAESSSAARGDARSGSAGGGGSQGASQSENEPQPEPTREPRRPSRPRPGARPGETQKGDPQQSAGAPSGPSSGGGQMTAVANERAGIDRGSERDDDTDTDDEQVEDEEEESEQRGGVMPSTRDRMQPPSRELSISGNGPPGDGRGGPTPPKKSRGTASLVLGIRLPDQVRGQPNPGTAKTTIEQVPPVPRDAAAHPTTPAPSDGPSPNVQSGVPAHAELERTVLRYHELLKDTNDG